MHASHHVFWVIFALHCIIYRRKRRKDFKLVYKLRPKSSPLLRQYVFILLLMASVNLTRVNMKPELPYNLRDPDCISRLE